MISKELYIQSNIINMIYSKKLYIKALLKFWGLFGILAIFLLLDFYYVFSKTNLTIKTLEILLVFFFGYFMYPIYFSIRKKFNDIGDNILFEAGSARLGLEGEKIVYDWIKNILPEKEYIILSNVVLPKHKFDIDFIVIGPKGVIVLEAKNFTGQFHFSNDEYFQIKNQKRNVLPQSFDPREGVRRHIYHLREFFERNNFNDIRILKALVFVKEDNISVDGNTGIYIAKGFNSLKYFLDGITTDPIYTPEYCEKIRKILGNKR